MTLASVLGALSAPSPVRPAVTPRVSRWRVATLLSEAVQGSAGAREIQRLAREVAVALPLATDAHHAEARRVAIAVRDRVAEHAEPVPVMLAALRELLTDAPCGGAEELDRAVRDAARAEGHDVSARHVAAAVAILAGAGL